MGSMYRAVGTLIGHSFESVRMLDAVIDSLNPDYRAGMLTIVRDGLQKGLDEIEATNELGAVVRELKKDAA